MSERIQERRFYRDRERGILFGVCAGIADYFGFDLKVTRILAVVALLLSAPMTLLVYFGIALLIPYRPVESVSLKEDPDFRKALRSSPQATMAEIRRRFQRLDSRLARMERYVTSPRFDLDREFRDLEGRSGTGGSE
ncbi:MAG: envelope stress response membrane protein PspC [Gammaproteobacteria bacterium]